MGSKIKTALILLALMGGVYVFKDYQERQKRNDSGIAIGCLDYRQTTSGMHTYWNECSFPINVQVCRQSLFQADWDCERRTVQSRHSIANVLSSGFFSLIQSSIVIGACRQPRWPDFPRIDVGAPFRCIAQ